MAFGIDLESLDQLAGQRLMAGFDGLELNAYLHFLINTLKVGGLILFRRNIQSPEQVRRLCAAAQQMAQECGQPPLFIAIDQEGGQVARLREPFTVFPGNPAMAGPDDARHFGRVTAAELGEIGVNMNMAPVLDVAPKDMDSIMADRAFGGEPQYVAQMGCMVIDALQQGRIMAVAKHFPGIGRTVLDSHLDMPTLAADINALLDFDLIPFIAAIQAQVAGVMLSHIYYPRLDEKWPASLSPVVARDVLRGRLGYQGLVLTDDLDMGAIEKHFQVHAVAEQILAAEIDLALVCHQGPKIETVFNCIKTALEGSAALRESGRQSVKRILTAKNGFCA